MLNLPDQQAGQPISAAWLNRIKNAVVSILRGGAIRGGRGILVSSTAGGIIIEATGTASRGRPSANNILAQITATANDYVTVRRVVLGAMVGDPFDVAKPFKLRHDAAEFANVTTLTGSSNDGNTVTASNGTDEEEWEVRPYPYGAGDRLLIAPMQGTGVVVGGEAIAWIDMNIDARAWTDITGNVGSAVSA